MTTPAIHQPLADIDLTDTRLWMSDPHPTLHRLRAEAPVHWHESNRGHPMFGHPFWALTRHRDVTYVSRHPELFNSGNGFQVNTHSVGFSDYDTFAMLQADDPYHGWVRALVSKAFTAKMVITAEAYIREITRTVLDEAAALGGEFNFVDEISAKVPIRVIGDMLGVPREDQRLLKTWTDALIDLDDVVIDQHGTPRSAKASAAVTDMFTYLEHLQQLRAANPGDDLISKLMAAEINGERLTWRQQREIFFVLVTAGNETTRNTTSCGVRALAEHPDQRRQLCEDPGLIKQAVEEMLRWGTVVSHFRRTATQDTVIGDQPIAKGDWVVMYYSAANRDPETFTDPDRFDIHRNPKQHVAFGGGGPHFCLGAPLARLQLRVAFEELLARFPSYDLAGPIRFNDSSLFHGIKQLPVRLNSTR